VHQLAVCADHLADEVLDGPPVGLGIARIDDKVLEADEFSLAGGVEVPCETQGGDEALGPVAAHGFVLDLEGGLRLLRVEVGDRACEDGRVAAFDHRPRLVSDAGFHQRDQARCAPHDGTEARNTE
jgi:hypothetical protein